QNRMSGHTYGAELSGTWQAGPRFRMRGAYGVLRIRLRADAALPAATRNSAQATASQNPEQQGWLQSSWDVRPDLQLDLTGRLVSRLHGFNPSGVGGGDVIDGYATLDARVAWRAGGRIELSLVGQNLLDSHHPETGTAQFLRSAP